MAEEKKIATGYIGNALRSAADNHTTTFADEIFDTERQKYQNEVNVDLETKIAEEKAAIIGTDRIADTAVTYDKLQTEIKEVVEGITYIENPEFLSIKTDAEGKLLWWIEKDGTVNWSKGVPQPIQVKLQELEQKIKDNADDDKILEERVTANEAAIIAINEALDNYKAEVAEALSKKMDGEYIENPEFIHVYTDSEGKILWALLNTGKVLYGAGVPDQIMELVNEIYDTFGRYEENPEFIHTHTDSEGKLLWWIEKDGTVGWSKGVPTPIQDELKKLEQLIKDNTEGDESVVDRIAALEVAITKKVDGEYIENPEFMAVITDSEERILDYIDKNGKRWIHDLHTDNIPENFSEIEDIEGRISINTDNEYRIISYRDKEGIIHENVGIETTKLSSQNAEIENINSNRLNLSKVGLTEFEQALKENGFTGGQGDWSTASSLHIPIPRCAIMNITSVDGKPYSWPTSKFTNNKVWVEFSDMQGNYFKKRAIHNAQGSSSLGLTKKNGAFDFCNDEWIGDDTFEIKFGDWVYQDSFHAKAYYTDFFKGCSIVAYQFADMVEKSRGIFNDRPWKKALLKDYVLGTDQTNSAQIDDLTLQLNNEAKCHPDGFPCIIYVDGAFYGIYAFCLKKHRDNYHMEKDVAEHIHLDGELYSENIWLGNVNWKGFEIRNPKNLYYKEAQNGTFEYDADVAQAEIAGYEEVNAWIEAGQLPDGTEITSKIEKRLRITAKVKNYIQELSNAIPLMKSASTTEEKKALFNKYFDKDNLIDYEIVQMATGDNDGYGKNWQWTTYDGIKWWVNEYDKDMSFGGHSTGRLTQAAPTTGGWMGNSINTPLGWPILLYQEDIVSQWKKLYGNIISVDTIMNLFEDWLNRIGTDNFSKEYGRWTQSPCNRDDNVDTIHWRRTNTYKTNVSYLDYDDSKTYMPGETCFYGFNWVFEFECIAETTGNAPITKGYSLYPQELGYRDSIWRLYNYVKQRLEKENEFINGL